MIGLIATAFVFVLYENPMTDERTYEARIGTDRASIGIFCGAASNGKMAVEFNTPRSLYRYMGSKAQVQWRFDSSEPRKEFVEWGDRRAIIVGDDALEFARDAQRAGRLRAVVTAAYGNDIVFDTPISDENGTIDRVIESCFGGEAGTGSKTKT